MKRTAAAVRMLLGKGPALSDGIFTYDPKGSSLIFFRELHRQRLIFCLLHFTYDKDTRNSELVPHWLSVFGWLVGLF